MNHVRVSQRTAQARMKQWKQMERETREGFQSAGLVAFRREVSSQAEANWGLKVSAGESSTHLDWSHFLCQLKN